MGSPALLTMKAIFFLLSTLLGSLVAPNPRFTCGECVDEMHHLGRMVKDGADTIKWYLIANYCPTLDDSSLCEEHLAEECVAGMEWVESYLEDPIMVAEYVVYLEHNFCLDEWHGCVEGVKDHFPPMHAMAMEKFMIPVEICNTQPVCGADPPTRPPAL